MFNNYIRFLLFGILFLGIQEFWVSTLWGGSFFNFILAVIVTEITFLTLGYFLIKLFKKLFSERISNITTYVFSGLLGLILIEWIFMGYNLSHPDNGNLWSQFTMFTNWGGIILFAKIMLDNSNEIFKLKKYMFRFFISFTGFATFMGLLFLFINSQITFVVTYLATIIGYPLMNIFFIWYFIKKK